MPPLLALFAPFLSRSNSSIAISICLFILIFSQPVNTFPFVTLLKNSAGIRPLINTDTPEITVEMLYVPLKKSTADKNSHKNIIIKAMLQNIRQVSVAMGKTLLLTNQNRLVGIVSPLLMLRVFCLYFKMSPLNSVYLFCRLP